MKRLTIILAVAVLIAECPVAMGATWEPMDSGTTEPLLDVWGTASNNVYAVGNSGTILHYDGSTWGQLPQQTTTQLFGVSGSGPNDVYVVGHGETGMSTVLRYDGDTWESLPMPDVAYDICLEGIWVSGSDAFAVGYHGAETGQIIHWQNGNLSSHNVIDGPLGSTALFEVWGRGSDDVYASGYDGYSSGTTGLMCHYNGSTWELFPLPQDVPSKTRGVFGVWGTNDSSELFLVGQSYGGPSDWFAEALYYNGTGWQTEIFQGSTESVLLDVWGSSLNDVYLVGYNYNGNGMILHGSSEFSWSMMDSGTTERLMGIWGNGPGDVFVVGNNGTILRLTEPPEVEMEWVTISEAGFAGQMSKYETTNAQYCQFLNAALDNGLISVLDDNVVYATSDTSYSKPFFNTNNGDSHSQITYNGDNFTVNPPRNGYDMNEHPVVEVSFYGAEAFCDYYGYRLPTEDEWEAVADYDGSFIYGCGTTIDHSKANYDDYNPLGLSSHPYTSQVGYYEAYGYALYDMSGNAKEWTTSYWGEGFEDRQILRGGSWGHAVTGCTVSSRDWQYKSDRHYNTGFRVVHTAEPPEPNISVSPLTYDFGDVEIGSAETMLVSVTNTGDGDLTVTSLDFQAGSSSDFSITSAPALPATIAIAATVDVEITFSPSILYFSSAILEIGSDDADESLVEVSLSGVGVWIEPPPDEQIEDILDFIVDSVEDGNLAGDGPGSSADKRLNALINMIEAAGDLITAVLYDQAHQQLEDAYKKCDGQSPPPDFVSGPAASELAERIQDLMETIIDMTSGRVVLLDNVENIPSLWTIGRPADVIKFTGDVADELRALEEDDHLITIALFAGLQFDGIVSSFLASEGSLDEFFDNLAQDMAPEIALGQAGLAGEALLLANSLFQFLQAYSVAQNILDSTDDIYIVFPEYPHYEIEIEEFYYTGVLFAADDLTSGTLSQLNLWIDAVHYDSFDEEVRNPDGYTLGKANFVFLQGYVPVPNNYYRPWPWSDWTAP